MFLKIDYFFSSVTLSHFSQTMQYVILTYMKYLGVKVKEPRGLEHKRARINFLPKIKVWSLQTHVSKHLIHCSDCVVWLSSIMPTSNPTLLMQFKSFSHHNLAFLKFYMHRRASNLKKKVKRRWKSLDFTISWTHRAVSAEWIPHQVRTL